MPLNTDVLNQLIEQIREEGSFVLASPDDANFFRDAFGKKKKPAQTIEPPKPPPNQELHVIREAPKPPEKAPPPPPKAPEQVVEAQKLPSKQPPLPKKAPADFSHLRNVLSKAAPELTIVDEIPSDAVAIKIAERWRTKNQSAPISILTYQEQTEQRALLEQISRAIDVYFGPAKIVDAAKIESDKQWGAFLSVKNLKMIVVCDYTLWQLGHLMEHYKEVPANKTRVLGKVPLFLLPDLSLYLKDPLLKRSLWNALKQKCQHL